MRKRMLLLAFSVLLVLSLIIAFFYVIRFSSFSRTWRVPKDYSTIQLAINNAADGDTIKVDSGVYYEHLVVNKSLSFIGQDRDATILDGNGTGTVVYITTNGVHITQFTVQNSGRGYGESGVYLSRVSHINLKNNKIVDCGDGVLLVDAMYCDVSGNIVSNNSYIGLALFRSNNNIINDNIVSFNGWSGVIGWSGIELTISENNIVTNNVVQNNYAGIRFFNEQPPLGKNNTLRLNRMSANKYNFGFRGAKGTYFESYIQSIDTSNTVDGKPIYYFVNQKDLVISPATYPHVGYLALINCSNVTVEGLTLTNNWQGLLLSNMNNSRITGCNITNNYYSVSVSLSYYNRICHNNFINSVQQVASKSSVNVWNDAYAFGGNYWSDYAGVDLFSGPNQNLPGSDGIGDTPYVIDADNRDNYPLMSLIT